MLFIPLARKSSFSWRRRLAGVFAMCRDGKNRRRDAGATTHPDLSALRFQHSEFLVTHPCQKNVPKLIGLIFLELPRLLSVSARETPAAPLANIALASLFFVSVRARLAEASRDRAGIRVP